MNQRQRLIFLNALTKDNPPLSAGQLRSLKEQYAKGGFEGEADILERRAKIAELSPKSQAAVKEAFKKGLSSTDSISVRNLANHFEAEGFFGNASKLREWANSLDVGATITQNQKE